MITVIHNIEYKLRHKIAGDIVRNNAGVSRAAIGYSRIFCAWTSRNPGTNPNRIILIPTIDMSSDSTNACRYICSILTKLTTGLRIFEIINLRAIRKNTASYCLRLAKCRAVFAWIIFYSSRNVSDNTGIASFNASISTADIRLTARSALIRDEVNRRGRRGIRGNNNRGICNRASSGYRLDLVWCMAEDVNIATSLTSGNYT